MTSKAKKQGRGVDLDPVRSHPVPAKARLYVVSCQLTIDMVASFKHSQLVHHLRIRLVTMAVYRVVALLADPDALRCEKMQPYPTSDAFATEVANHFSPFLALVTHKKGGSPNPTQGKDYPPYKKCTKRRLPPPSCAWLFLWLSVQLCYCSISLMRLLPFVACDYASALLQLPLQP